MISFDIIAAMDSDRGIGKKDRLPWRLSGELKHFKTLTCKTNSPQKQNAVIMGRKTWESLPEKYRPLPNRLNLVITRNPKPVLPAGVFFAPSLESALQLLTSSPLKEKVAHRFVIGGAKIFETALPSPFCQRLYLTHLRQSFQCDTFFPPFEKQFEQSTVLSDHEENGISYYFAEYKRRIIVTPIG